MTTAPKPRFKEPSMEKLYRSLLEQAADPESELNKGPKVAGQYATEVQKVFWESFNGVKLYYVQNGTLLFAAAAAGKEWAKKNSEEAK